MLKYEFQSVTDLSVQLLNSTHDVDKNHQNVVPFWLILGEMHAWMPKASFGSDRMKEDWINFLEN